MFKEEREESQFARSMRSDIVEGRPNLSRMVHVAGYRLMKVGIRTSSPIRGFLVLVSLVLFSIFLQGCMALNVRHPLPENLLDEVQVDDLIDVRAWGDKENEGLKKSATESLEQERAANHGKLLPEADILALSGGAGDGAFGAGFLCGWTEAGTRPTFKAVTGISTGALIAVFAFLGPEYDAKLKEAYTTISDKDIYRVHSVLTLLLNLGRIEAAGSTEPLAELLERFIDDNIIRAVAIEHNKGRRLVVGTTQLDAQRLVIWNMGAIAAKGTPEAFKLFRQVLRASASIPVAFNPVYIKVKAGGQEYDEMHVDGGVRAEVMIYENALNISGIRKGLGPEMPHRDVKLYIIRNAQVYPEFKAIRPHIDKIGSRAITSLTKFQGIGDLYRIYVLAKRDNIDYNLAFIPDTFHQIRTSEFDNDYMKEEFKMAYNLAHGYKWSKCPPGYENCANPESAIPVKAPVRD